MGVLMEEKKGYAASFDQSMSERRNVTGFIKGVFDQRYESSQEAQAKIAERQEHILKDNFEVVSLAPQTACRTNRRCASASECEGDRQSGFAPAHEQILTDIGEQTVFPQVELQLSRHSCSDCCS